MDESMEKLLKELLQKKLHGTLSAEEELILSDLVVRKRKTEVEAQFAPVLEAGYRCGIAMPTLERLAAMIREMEVGRRGFSRDNLAELAN